MLRSIICGVVAFAGLSVLAGESKEWGTDYEAALRKAKEENKHVLLDFSGSDWCGWCIKLDEEVFSKKPFKDYAATDLVLVLVDFPRGKKQSDELKKQNEKLAEKYRIRGFPTVILLDSEGKLVGRTGYQQGGPEKYVKHLQELVGKGKKKD